MSLLIASIESKARLSSQLRRLLFFPSTNVGVLEARCRHDWLSRVALLAIGELGSEIKAPMALVILCGLASSTALNMLVLPAIYLRIAQHGGRRSAPIPAIALEENPHALPNREGGPSGVIVAIVSEVARKSPGFGALIASLPLVSILGMIWLWRDTSDPVRLADHAQATFWFVLPSLPMFLLVPMLLKHGIAFWPALLRDGSIARSLPANKPAFNQGRVLLVIYNDQGLVSSRRVGRGELPQKFAVGTQNHGKLCWNNAMRLRTSQVIPELAADLQSSA